MCRHKHSWNGPEKSRAQCGQKEVSERQQEGSSWKMGGWPLEVSEQRSDLPCKDHSESWLEHRPWQGTG